MNNENNLLNRLSLSETPITERPTLKEGDTGEWVEELQRELTQLTFYNGPINGNFNSATRMAVEEFQKNNNLTVDGVVGRSTWSSLIFLYAPLAICPNSGLMPYPFKGIVIDAGHGGTDPGASGNDIIEKNMTLMISMYMNDRFYELNVPHSMTRTSDETLTREERISRIKNAFGSYPGVIVISNHINAGGGEGAEVIYALRNTDTYPKMILNEIKLAGQVVRRVYQRVLPEDPSKDYYYVIRDTNPMQTVLVEYGFLDNAADADRLKHNWKRYAEAVVKATCDYIGFPYRPPYEDVIVYTVQAGDTLWSIAQRFQTTVAELRRINNLTSDVLTIGQQLKIPMFGVVPPEEPTFTYTVVAGDSLWSIAQRFGTTVAELRRINNLTSDVLRVGQQLQIPGTGAEVPGGIFTYTVVRGDSLWSIAQRFGTTVAELRRINNLTSDVLTIGQQLKIPGAAPGGPGGTHIHTVIRGDSLWSIAQRFGTTVNAIIAANNLTTTLLTIGQQLIIPL